MKTPKKILIPVDLSLYSMVAVQYGQEIAELFDAEVIITHVNERERHAETTAQSPDFPEKLEPERRKRIMEVIQHQLVDRNLVSRSVRIDVRFGSPVREIMKAAEELHADLIIMSTHGRTGLRHVLLGSVAEKVVRFAKCPVLTIKPEEVRELIDLTENDVALTLHLQDKSAETTS